MRTHDLTIKSHNFEFILWMVWNRTTEASPSGLITSQHILIMKYFLYSACSLSIMLTYILSFCRHIFHKSCVDPWLLDQRSCPMCKLDILRAYGMQVRLLCCCFLSMPICHVQMTSLYLCRILWIHQELLTINLFKMRLLRDYSFSLVLELQVTLYIISLK